jgi:tetratricopeptide (TPR) repeat protein
LKFDQVNIDRMNALAEKNRHGMLTEVVQQELRSYLLVGHFLDLLHSKAREDARADRAVRLARERGERGYEAWALRLLGDMASHHDRPDVATADAHYGAAMDLASELGMRPLAAHCHRSIGTLYAKIGRLEQAHAEFSTAIDLYRTMDMTFWLPQAEAALARVEGGENTRVG